MPGYDTLIAEAIAAAGYPDHADGATVALIEDCMRTNRTGLDHLTREAFTLEVAVLIEDLVSDPDATRALCRILGFATPIWLDNSEQATVLPWPATCRHITAALAAAFPHTRFIVTTGHGQGRGHAVVRWTGGPARSSVTDVLAQFLPGDSPDQPRYGLIAIYPCRINGLNETDRLMTQDTLFDLEALAREAVAATPWHGAPLTYTADYWTPDELDAAFDRYRAEFGDFGCLPRSHMWHRALCHPPLVAAGHELHLFSVNNRCTETDHDHTAQPLPEGYLGQVICPTCRWHLIDTDSLLVEAWHDHAMPGWRNLPVLPDKLRTRCDENRQSKQRRLEWVQEHYPPQWLFDGAPILTHRTQDGTCAVPGRSPLGGYDITAPAETGQP